MRRPSSVLRGQSAPSRSAACTAAWTECSAARGADCTPAKPLRCGADPSTVPTGLANELSGVLLVHCGFGDRALDTRDDARYPPPAPTTWRLTGPALVTAMCIGQVGNLLPHVVVPAIMAQHLMPLWGLSGANAGLMAGAYALGYMLAAPLLTALTDRVDARRILFAGSAASALATLAFGLFADGLWSASAIWALAGAGFAGAYMPGLKALTDRIGAAHSSRAVTLYTSSFSIGVGLSFLVAQLVADGIGWRDAFLVTALGPLAMMAVCLAMAPFKPAAPHGHVLDFRPVLRNRAALGYIFGYGAHCFELYGMRTWIVAFWTFVAAQNGGTALLSPVSVSVIV